MTSAGHAGGCLCGGVRYRASGAVRDLCYCHCTSCRRAAGAPFVAWGTVGESSFTVTEGSLSIVRSSEPVERGFCGACGTSLTYRNAQRPLEIDFTLATLDEPGAFAPRMHIWVQDKLPWLQIADTLPQYATVPGAA